MKSFSSLVTLSAMLVLTFSCGGDESFECQLFDENVQASIQVDGSAYCIEWAAIRYDTRNGAPPALQIASIENPSYPELLIGWRLEGTSIEFGVEYTDFVDEFSYLKLDDGTEYEIKSGSLIVEGSNYPNPSILRYYGSFDLTYSNENNQEKRVIGQFSLKL